MDRMFWNCWNDQKEERIDIGDAWVFLPVHAEKQRIVECVKAWMSARKTVKMLGLQETKAAEAESDKILIDVMNILTRRNIVELWSLYAGRFESRPNLYIDYAFYKAYWRVNVNRDSCDEQKELADVRSVAFEVVKNEKKTLQKL